MLVFYYESLCVLLICVYCFMRFLCVCFFFFFKQKTAYEMRISDWSSDVCSSDLFKGIIRKGDAILWGQACAEPLTLTEALVAQRAEIGGVNVFLGSGFSNTLRPEHRSEEHTSELQSLMHTSYAVFCLKKKKIHITTHQSTYSTNDHQKHTQ